MNSKAFGSAYEPGTYITGQLHTMDRYLFQYRWWSKQNNFSFAWVQLKMLLRHPFFNCLETVYDLVI